MKLLHCLALFLLFVVLVVVPAGRAAFSSGLYIMHRNESTRLVTVRQVAYDGAISQWKVPLGQCPVYVEIVTYSIMDTKRHIFVGQFMGLPYFYAVDLATQNVTHIPTLGGYDRYRCLSVDTENETLVAMDAYTKKLNSIDWTTGKFTPLMNVSSVIDIAGDGHCYDSKTKILSALTLDWTSDADGYVNTLNVIDIMKGTITRNRIACQYKVCYPYYDHADGCWYAMAYEAGWLDGRQHLETGKSAGFQPSNQTVYIGKIEWDSWTFQRLVSLVVPFYSNNFLTAYSPSRGHYALAWPEPDYSPYVESNNGVLQIVDVRNSKTLFNDQVKGWTMRGRVGASQMTQLILDFAYSD